MFQLDAITVYSTQDDQYFPSVTFNDLQALDKSKDFIFVTHGFSSSIAAIFDGDDKMRGALDQYYDSIDTDAYIVFYDWFTRSGNGENVEQLPQEAAIAAGNVPIVGAEIADLVNFIRPNPDQTSLIGHSFGAHVMAEAGRLYQASDPSNAAISRIIGLDASAPQIALGPLVFTGLPDFLDPTDGRRVVNLHTSSWSSTTNVGDVDIYINGGYSADPAIAQAQNLNFNINADLAGYVQPFGTGPFNTGQGYHAYAIPHFDSLLRGAAYTTESSAVNQIYTIEDVFSGQLLGRADVKAFSPAIEGITDNFVLLKSVTGNDFNNPLNGGSGSDRLYGLGGHDWMLGRAGPDILYGGQGNDQVEGNEGADQLFGGQGKDTITGGAGNDFINGGLGYDSLDGGAGENIFKFDGSFGVDTISNFQNTADHLDKIDLTSLGLSWQQVEKHLIYGFAETIVVNLLPYTAGMIWLESPASETLSANDFIF